MGDVGPLATAEDYESIYGGVGASDAARLPALLLRASGYLLSYMPDYEAGADAVLDLNASTVCCAMAHRVLCAPGGMEGVGSFSQAAGGYSATVSMLDQYMRPLPSERELLGIGDGCVVTMARIVPPEVRHEAD